MTAPTSTSRGQRGRRYPLEHVISRDSTRIACRRHGSGPAVVIVHGSMSGTRWNSPSISRGTSRYTHTTAGASVPAGRVPFVPPRRAGVKVPVLVVFGAASSCCRAWDTPMLEDPQNDRQVAAGLCRSRPGTR